MISIITLSIPYLSKVGLEIEPVQNFSNEDPDGVSIPNALGAIMYEFY